MQHRTAKRTSYPELSLQRLVPVKGDERPAFAGDPDFDWENRAEAPREPQWGIRDPENLKARERTGE